MLIFSLLICGAQNVPRRCAYAPHTQVYKYVHVYIYVQMYLYTYIYIYTEEIYLYIYDVWIPIYMYMYSCIHVFFACVSNTHGIPSALNHMLGTSANSCTSTLLCRVLGTSWFKTKESERQRRTKGALQLRAKTQQGKSNQFRAMTLAGNHNVKIRGKGNPPVSKNRQGPSINYQSCHIYGSGLAIFVMPRRHPAPDEGAIR